MDGSFTHSFIHPVIEQTPGLCRDAWKAVRVTGSDPTGMSAAPLLVAVGSLVNVPQAASEQVSWRGMGSPLEALARGRGVALETSG